MWIDITALLATAALAWLGFRRGAFATLLQMLLLVASYALAFLLAPIFGPSFARALGVSDFLGSGAANLAVGTATYAVLALAVYLARRGGEGKRRASSLGDRLGGAALGVGQGAFVALLLGVLGSWMEAGRTVGKLEGIPDVGTPQVTRFSRVVIETTAGPAIGAGDAGSRIALRLTTRPSETLRALETVMQSSEVQGLQGDHEFWSAVESGQLDQALNSRSFAAFGDRREMREQLAAVGLVDERGVEDPAFFRQEMRMMLGKLGPRLRALRSDPALAKLAGDPDVMKAVQERNIAVLLVHPDVRSLMARVLEQPPQP